MSTDDKYSLARTRALPPTPEEVARVLNPSMFDRAITWLGWWIPELLGALFAGLAAAWIWTPLLIVTIVLLARIGLDPWIRHRQHQATRRRVATRLAAEAKAKADATADKTEDGAADDKEPQTDWGAAG